VCTTSCFVHPRQTEDGRELQTPEAARTSAVAVSSVICAINIVPPDWPAAWVYTRESLCLPLHSEISPGTALSQRRVSRFREKAVSNSAPRGAARRFPLGSTLKASGMFFPL